MKRTTDSRETARIRSKSVISDKKSVESEVLRNQLARALADYDNLRKRVEEEREIWIKFSSERVIIKLLPILDAFEAAQAHLSDQGLAIAIGEFKKVFAEEGIEEIRPKVGEAFDANIHEAIEVVSGGKRGYVAELVLAGWKFEDMAAQAGGKIIRFAKVKVYGERVNKKEEL